ncbi:hypothetical protein M3Y99_00107100 [Aphelenchoides fujianensis]|nr:hypothetical protein M3Y99_00107100 [Aphelenchoides fujianensis]
MRVVQAPLVVVALFFGSVNGWPNPLFSSYRREFGKSKFDDDLPDQFFTQQLDHFDSTVQATWQQRFWLNDAYHSAGGPEFLHVGTNDEETAEAIANPDRPLVRWAAQFGARLWSLEHRFWGRSRPLPDLSTENLRFLNAPQALEDISAFIRNKSAVSTGRWVLFGGGWGGSLALWHRRLHPTDTIGAVGSSAQMEARFDYFGERSGAFGRNSSRVAEDVFRNHSTVCAENLRAGFFQLHALMDSADGRQQVDAAFGLAPPLAAIELTPTHLQNFYHVVAGLFLLPVQFNAVNSAPWNAGVGVAAICEILERPALNAVARLVNVVQFVKRGFGEPPGAPLENDFDAAMARFRNVSFDGDSAADRAQVWQNCNEMGGVPATTYNGIWGTDVPVNYYYSICESIFGSQFTADFVRARMLKTTERFGRARDFNATNVVAPMGGGDPYRALRLAAANNPTVTPLLIDGAAFCADTMPVNDTTDSAALKAARQLIGAKLAEWVDAAGRE